VTDAEGATSERDEVEITVNPTQSSTSNEVEDEARTFSDEIAGIIKNPVNITSSIDSADRIKEILTDNN
jgi:hypothetical protein